MALNKEYFDSINLEIAKKKYYNANKVEAVLSDIRAQAIELQRENDSLKLCVSELAGDKGTEDMILKAKSIADGIIADAEQKASDIIRKAEREAAELSAAGTEPEGNGRCRAVLNRIRNLQLQIIDELEDELDSLGGEQEELVPADLEQKIGAIADRLFSIGNDD